jgi:hypothetical protein
MQRKLNLWFDQVERWNHLHKDGRHGVVVRQCNISSCILTTSIMVISSDQGDWRDGDRILNRRSSLLQRHQSIFAQGKNQWRALFLLLHHQPGALVDPIDVSAQNITSSIVEHVMQQSLFFGNGLLLVAYFKIL